LICETYYRAVCRTFHSICLKDWFDWLFFFEPFVGTFVNV
jgi:hypothetical protein